MSPLLMPFAMGSTASAVLVRAAEAVVEQGPDLTGIAALIASAAGVISAVGGLIIGLRTQKAKVEDIRSDVLMEMLLKALDEPESDGSGERR